MKYKTRIEKIFKAWETRDWDFVAGGLAEDFTFTSPYDDHLSKEDFKEKCWNTIKEIGEFEIVTIVEGETEAFVRYKNKINGEKVQNTEQFIFEGDKLKEVVVFFGRAEDVLGKGK
jgi:ketosteroid isomerase-like protein